MSDAVQQQLPETETPPIDTETSPADPPPRDRPPRARAASGSGTGRGGKRPGAGRPKGAKNKPKTTGKTAAKSSEKVSDAALRATLGQLLVLPTVGAAAIPDDDTREFTVDHFTGMAPIVSERLIAISKRSPELRETLEKLATGSVKAELIGLGIAYIAPPVLFIVGARTPAQLSQALMFSDDPQAMILRPQQPVSSPADGSQAQSSSPAEAAAAAQAAAAAYRAQTQPRASTPVE